MSVLFALAAAFSNSFNVVSQHVASIRSPPGVKGLAIGLFLIRQPLWLLGVVAMAAALAIGCRRLGMRTPGPRPIVEVRSAARASVTQTSG